MWKDFFYFSKGQRRGTIVLIALIFIVIVLNFLLPYFFPKPQKQDEAFLKEAAEFEKKLISTDSLRKTQWAAKYQQNNFYPHYKEYHSQKKEYPKDISTKLTYFDPNTADSATLVGMGIKPFVVKNILRYRAVGGYYKTAIDFGKTYGLTPDKFKELESFIRIEERKRSEPSPIKKIISANIMVEVNSADTTQLQQLKGIGTKIARNIVKYRQILGGYAHIDQLSEVYGMKNQTLNDIRTSLKLNVDLIQKINVNTASVARLKTHPYIGFYRAKAIYEYRRNKVKLKSIDELKNLEEIKPEDLKKLEPYLIFE